MSILVKLLRVQLQFLNLLTLSMARCYKGADFFAKLKAKLLAFRLVTKQSTVTYETAK